jgi:tRNA-specific 2-thiouridylase
VGGKGETVPERIVVGLSGGVDSSVAAALLVAEGVEVVGVTLRVWPWREAEDPGARFGSCCSSGTANDARGVARRLGIPYYLLNSEAEFDRRVVTRFADEYARGRTPVPCVVCNREVKFGSLLGRARAWGARAVATGHYARVTRDEATGRYLLWRGRDPRKDQSDFLWPLTQEQLAGARFPVGHLTKEEVREHARRAGLATADSPESQEICFIQDGDYRAFLRRRSPAAFVPGPIVDARGRRLGTHSGVAGFTIGQRRGLGITARRPLYVTALDAQRNTVVVGEAEEMAVERCRVESVNLIAHDRLTRPTRVSVKIRHSHTPVAATIRPVEAGESLEAEVVFDDPQRAVAAGQSAVFYDRDLVIGGGVIAA